MMGNGVFAAPVIMDHDSGALDDDNLSNDGCSFLSDGCNDLSLLLLSNLKE